MHNFRVAAAAILATLVLSPRLGWGTASADHGAGMPLKDYVPGPATRPRSCG